MITYSQYVKNLKKSLSANVKNKAQAIKNGLSSNAGLADAWVLVGGISANEEALQWAMVVNNRDDLIKAVRELHSAEKEFLVQAQKEIKKGAYSEKLDKLIDITVAKSAIAFFEEEIDILTKHVKQ